MKDLERVKSYLRQIKILDTKINRRMEQLSEIKSLATRVTSVITPDRVQTSGPGNNLENAMVRYLDIENEVKKTIDEYVETKNRIIKEIEQLSDDRFISVLSMRYLDYLPWEDIADELYMSERQVFRIHGKALIAFSELLEQGDGLCA